MPEQDESFTPNVFNDTYLCMEIALPRGRGDQEDIQFAKVTKRLCNKDGHPIRMAIDNPLLLETQEHKVS